MFFANYPDHLKRPPLLQRKQSGKVTRVNLLFSVTGKTMFLYVCAGYSCGDAMIPVSLSAAAAAAGCFSNTNRGSLIHRNLRSHVISRR